MLIILLSDCQIHTKRIEQTEHFTVFLSLFVCSCTAFSNKKKNLKIYLFRSVSSSDSESVEVKSVYGVEGNSTFLECFPRTPQAELRWTMQHADSQQQTLSQMQESREVRLSSFSLHRWKSVAWCASIFSQKSIQLLSDFPCENKCENLSIRLEINTQFSLLWSFACHLGIIYYCGYKSINSVLNELTSKCRDIS